MPNSLPKIKYLFVRIRDSPCFYGNRTRYSFTNGFLPEAIDEAVRQGYKEGFLRKSIVKEPIFSRINTNDNTPAIIHQEFIAEKNSKITFIPKGGGAENMSRLRMLKVSAGKEGIKKFLL